MESEGNPLAHCILRGYADDRHITRPNSQYDTLKQLSDLYSESGVLNPAAIVDCNHSNSNKQPQEQPRIAKDVLHSMSLNGGINSMVKGLMIESYLIGGCQSETGSVFGQSITDPCLGWDESEKLIYEIADLLKK